jgi:hypothetical protein
MKTRTKQTKVIQEPTPDTPLSVLYEIKSLIEHRYDGPSSPYRLADRFENMLDEIEHSIKKVLKDEPK